jgi:valyl-tRNA synthetase
LIDTWILSRLAETIKAVENNFDKVYNLNTVINVLRTFFYQNFCDFYIECSKVPLPNRSSNNQAEIEIVWNVLRNCINKSLLMYHPIMPSMTEELWQRNKLNSERIESILELEYPKFDKISKFKVKFLN